MIKISARDVKSVQMYSNILATRNFLYTLSSGNLETFYTLWVLEILKQLFKSSNVVGTLSENGEHMDITPPTSLHYFWCFKDTNNMIFIIIKYLKTIKDVSGSCYSCYILKHLYMQICFFCFNIRYCFSTFARIQTSYQGPHAVILSQSQFQQTLLCMNARTCYGNLSISM